MNEQLAIVIAVLAMVVGLVLYALIRTQAPKYFNVINPVVWLLMALFPVTIIYLAFPESEFSSDFQGIKAGGAIGAYLLLFWWGTRAGQKAYDQTASERAIADRERLLAAREAAAAPGASSEPMSMRKVNLYKFKNATRKRIGVVGGRIEGVDFADVWVNSENTNMQMARFFDRSVSGTIRYFGATRDEGGDVLVDTIADELAVKRGARLEVAPATVFETGSGELATEHHVQFVLHVAAVRGSPGAGYSPVDNIERCVEAVLKYLDHRAEGEHRARSVVMPLFGAGSGHGDVARLAPRLFDAALDHMARHAQCPVEVVYFMSFTTDEWATCNEVLAGDSRVEFEREGAPSRRS